MGPEKRGQNRSPIIRRQALGTEATRSPCEDCRGRRGSMRTHDRYLGTGDTDKRGAAGGGFQSQSALSFHPAVCPWARRGQAAGGSGLGPVYRGLSRGAASKMASSSHIQSLDSSLSQPSLPPMSKSDG